MIEVYYWYYSITSHNWTEETNTYDDVVKAFRFIKSVENNIQYIIKGWKCYDNEDNDYLAKRVRLRR